MPRRGSWGSPAVPIKSSSAGSVGHLDQTREGPAANCFQESTRFEGSAVGVQYMDKNFELAAYEEAWREVEEDRKDVATWAKAFAENQGGEAAAKASYLTLRVSQLVQEKKARIESERLAELSRKLSQVRAQRFAELSPKIKEYQVDFDRVRNSHGPVGNVNYANSYGETALMMACDRGDFDTARTLLAFGADPAVMDKDGRTARDYSKKRERFYELLDVAAILQHGPKGLQIQDSVAPTLTDKNVGVDYRLMSGSIEQLTKGGSTSASVSNVRLQDHEPANSVRGHTDALPKALQDSERLIGLSRSGYFFAVLGFSLIGVFIDYGFERANTGQLAALTFVAFVVAFLTVFAGMKRWKNIGHNQWYGVLSLLPLVSIYGFAMPADGKSKGLDVVGWLVVVGLLALCAATVVAVFIG